MAVFSGNNILVSIDDASRDEAFFGLLTRRFAGALLRGVSIFTDAEATNATLAALTPCFDLVKTPPRTCVVEPSFLHCRGRAADSRVVARWRDGRFGFLLPDDARLRFALRWVSTEACTSTCTFTTSTESAPRYIVDFLFG